MDIPITIEIKQNNLDRFLNDIANFTRDPGRKGNQFCAVKNFIESFPKRISSETDEQGIVTLNISPHKERLEEQ
jgi:NADP-dependent 3-hydroxy acid dehydrogenase YdfG